MELHVLTVFQDWDQKTSWCSNSNRHIDVVSSNNLVSIDNWVNDWVFLKGQSGGSDEETHESELDAVLFEEILTKFLSAVRSGLHVDFLEGRQESIVVLRFFKSLGNSLSQSWHGFSGLLSFEVGSSINSGDLRLWSWLFDWLGFSGWLWFRLLFFGLLFFSFFLFNLLFGLLFLSLLFWSTSSRFCSFRIDIKQWLSYIQTITSVDVEFKQFTGLWAFDFNGNFISFDIGDCFVLVNPISFLWNQIQMLLLTNSAIVPSLIESARKGRLTVLA